MTTNESGARPVSQGAATTTLSYHHEAGRCNDTAPARRAERAAPKRRPTWERYEEFNAQNPEFTPQIAALARRYREKTGSTCSIQRLVEIVRFDLQMKAKTSEEYRVNNDFAAYWAREIMEDNEDLRGFFETRRAPEADTWIALRRHRRAT